jgi:hypothetical protein
LIHLWAQDTDERQIAIAFSVIKAIANHEGIGNIETNIIDRHIGRAPFWFVEQGTNSQTGRIAAQELRA